VRRIALPLAAVLLIAAGDPKTETEHVVAPGETLRGIANSVDVPLVVIAEANGLSQPYAIRSGQKLVIPRQRTHVVERGETGFGIAYEYGVPFTAIALANSLDDKGTVRTGQRLIIPAVMPERAPFTTLDQPYFARPHDGEVLLGWRRRPDGGGHEGIDFAVATGDMVRAAAGGTVLVADEDDARFGRLVVIDHGNGWQSAYGHLSRITVARGDTVTAGERVGLGGQTGDAERPELHFEIRHGGEPVDPAPLLRLGRD
jgi:murein DD-endopeptidase MepM/ murein hydrolase activator NlpD